MIPFQREDLAPYSISLRKYSPGRNRFLRAKAVSLLAEAVGRFDKIKHISFSYRLKI